MRETKSEDGKWEMESNFIGKEVDDDYDDTTAGGSCCIYR